MAEHHIYLHIYCTLIGGSEHLFLYTTITRCTYVGVCNSIYIIDIVYTCYSMTSRESVLSSLVVFPGFNQITKFCRNKLLFESHLFPEFLETSSVWY
jgi:hypothetical protein